MIANIFLVTALIYMIYSVGRLVLAVLATLADDPETWEL